MTAAPAIPNACPTCRWPRDRIEGGVNRCARGHEWPVASANGPAELVARPARPGTNGTDGHHRGDASNSEVCEISEAWEPPVPFGEADRPEFPIDALPGWAAAWVGAEATATQTPPDLAGTLVLSALATACAGKVEVRVRPGWSEPLNIYTTTSLPSGERKSTVLKDAADPIERFEAEEIRRLAPEVADAESRRKIAEAALGRAQAEAAKAEASERPALIAEAGRLAAELSEMRGRVLPRLLADDVSPEKLAGLLESQGGKIAVLSPEGDFFDLLAGRYSSNGGPNLGTFLKGHAGDALRVDRVGRPPEFVPRPAITLGLAVQPEVIRGLAEKPGFRGRGVLARILYSVPVSLLGRREIDPPAVADAIVAGYAENIRSLLGIEMATDEDGAPVPHILAFDPGARKALERFAADLEPRLGEDGDLSTVTDWAGKLSGAVARLAALIHLADRATDATPWASPIDPQTVARAVRLGQYFLVHARVAFSEMGADETIASARRILRWIEAGPIEQFTRRDVHQALRAHFKSADLIDQPLQRLVGHGYVRQPPDDGLPRRGRPSSPTYDVNPLVAAQKSHKSQNSPQASIGAVSEICEISESEEVRI